MMPGPPAASTINKRFIITLSDQVFKTLNTVHMEPSNFALIFILRH